MAFSPEDPHSYSRPDLARVTHIGLVLNVDFARKVLKGKAILTIKRVLSTIDEVVLDNYGLLISNVTQESTKSRLKYQIGDFGPYGSKFTIQLPKMVEDDKKPCRVQIEYETSPNCLALYWLIPEQTAAGTHPFLLTTLSDNKPPFAKAVFPCQDTPSVKFTYSALITTPLNFTVLMSAPLSNSFKRGQVCYHIFFQKTAVPSYAVIMAVGVLQQYNLHNSKISIWFEKYSNPQITDTQLLSIFKQTETMLEAAESIHGAYPWKTMYICVLPPRVKYFKIKCPCLMFLSPTLISENPLKSIIWYIYRNWTEMLASEVKVDSTGSLILEPK